MGTNQSSIDGDKQRSGKLVREYKSPTETAKNKIKKAPKKDVKQLEKPSKKNFAQEYTDREIGQVQDKRYQDRHQLKMKSQSQFLSPQLISQADEKEKIRRLNTLAEDKLDSTDYYFGEEIIIEQQDQQMDQSNIEAQITVDQNQQIDFKKQSPTRKEELQNKVKMLNITEKEIRGKSKTNYIRLQLETQQAKCNQLLEKEEIFLQKQMEEQIELLSIRKDENEDIKFNLSLQTNNNSTFKGKQARDSITSQMYSRQSTITYQNYDSETKQSYCRLLIQQLPQLITEEKQLSEKVEQQNQQLHLLSEAQIQIQNKIQDINALSNKKEQLKQYSEILRKQIKEISDKKMYMSLEIMQIETQEKIESHLEQLQKKYIQDKPFILDLDSLKELEGHLEIYQYKLKISQLKKNHKSSIIDLSSSINQQPFAHDGFDNVINEHLGVSQQITPNHAEYISEEFNQLIKPKQDILINKFQQKLNQLEQSFRDQKQQQQTKIHQLEDEISNHKQIINMGVSVEDTLQQSQHSRLALMENIKKELAKEGPLNVEIQVQQSSIKFIEEQIKQISKKQK